MKETRIVSEEIRALTGEDGQPKLDGYAAVFNSETELWPGMREVIRPGAFARTIKNKTDVRVLFNHEVSRVLARTKNATLALDEDEHGLHYRAILNSKDAEAMSLHAKVARGDVDQSSFAFEIDGKDGEKFTAVEGGRMREVTRAKLYDVSPVTFPAYEDTEVMARVAFRNAPGDSSTISNEQANTEKHPAPEPSAEGHHSVSLLKFRLRIKEAENGDVAETVR